MAILSQEFLNKYQPEDVKFGFGALSEFVMLSKYSKIKSNGEKENWKDIVTRNVEGLFWLLNKEIRHTYTHFEQRLIAEELFDNMFYMRMLPAGRPLANLGSPLVQEKGMYASLFNCAFVSFAKIDPLKAFEFVMDMSMLGVGVGINVNIKEPRKLSPPLRYVEKNTFYVPDTKEGWIEGLIYLLKSHLDGDGQRFKVNFDYSRIRPAGSIIHGSGGIHTGYKPLEKMYEDIRNILQNNEYLTPRAIADICNLIGTCVVAGGQRRTALLLMGDQSDDEFINLKNYEMYPYRQDFGWTSNNSPIAKVGMSYKPITDRIKKGEDIGLIWLDNFRENGRMGEGVYEPLIEGANPCVEIGLENFELCNLVEVNPMKIADTTQAMKVLGSAVFFAKVISGLKTHWKETNDVISRNHRFGIGQTGITQHIGNVGIAKYKAQLKSWYKIVRATDDFISPKLSMTPSIKTTTVKPSGSLSLLMGTTAGVHYATSRFMRRRVRVAKSTGYDKYYRSKGYHVEDDIYDKNGNTAVIEFPVDYGENVLTIDNVTMYDQLNLASLLQQDWSDNGVSITVSFKKGEEDQIGRALNFYQYNLKAVTFLKRGETLYEQAPEEPTTQEGYEYLTKTIEREARKRTIWHGKLAQAKPDEFCSTDKCEINDFEEGVPLNHQALTFYPKTLGEKRADDEL
jgi:adenosylcobalamin-dependent ribonucleoside-triphosphate reductase